MSAGLGVVETVGVGAFWGNQSRAISAGTGEVTSDVKQTQKQPYDESIRLVHTSFAPYEGAYSGWPLDVVRLGR